MLLCATDENMRLKGNFDLVGALGKHLIIILINLVVTNIQLQDGLCIMPN